MIRIIVTVDVYKMRYHSIYIPPDEPFEYVVPTIHNTDIDEESFHTLNNSTLFVEDDDSG